MARRPARAVHVPRPLACPSTIARYTIHNGATLREPESAAAIIAADSRAPLQAPQPADAEAPPPGAGGRARRPRSDRRRVQPAARPDGHRRPRGRPSVRVELDEPYAVAGRS